MRQLLNNLGSGELRVSDVPCPRPAPHHILVRTVCSAISAGTERMLVEFGRANLLSKARQQPDKVRMVIEKARTDGLAATLESVRAKLDQSIPLGYCNAGVVIEAGPGVEGFRPGDRVVSNGPHAEAAHVPASLCARIPDSVRDEDAAFAVVSAIALQGIRLAQPTLGESCMVSGLGLIGLLTVQLLRANGCRVLATDYDPRRLEFARQFGADVVDLSSGEDPLRAADIFSHGRGLDVVIIAAATDSSDPVHQAAQACRKRGRIVLVGVTGLHLSRDDFYKKELSFQVACSYGPGRYDPAYEQKGADYPFGLVRWTAQRNFEAALDLIEQGLLRIEPLITHRFSLEDAGAAYDVITGGGAHLGVVLRYRSAAEYPDAELTRSVIVANAPSRAARGVSVGFVGAGGYATKVLIPAFRSAGAALKSVASGSGVSAAHAARKFGFERAGADSLALIRDADVEAIVIATRHDSHARYVCEALAAGRHVYVEKPLAMTLPELEQIEAALATASGRTPVLMVGFNRRFAPQVRKMRALLAPVREPKNLIVTINAGAVPGDHWTRDSESGGGRILGEACHFLDLLRFLTASRVARWRRSRSIGESASFELEFEDGSVGAVHYLASGHKSFPKERVEVFCGGAVLQLDNYRGLKGFGWPGFRKMNLWRQDKGNAAAVAAFVSAVRDGGPWPIPREEILEVSRTILEIARAQ